jgi:hypothetical protein
MPTDEKPLTPDTELKAPKGMYRVVTVDTFNWPYTDSLVGDFKTLVEARRAAQQYGDKFSPTHVYDDQGGHIVQYGSV